MTVGKRLAAARVERGLAVEDVSRATRIRPALVRAIEADDLAAAGPALYARGHIRTIATHLGVDPAPLLAEYDRRAPAPPPPAATLQLRDPAAARAGRHGQSWLGAMVVTAAAVVVLLGVGLAVEPRDDVLVVTDPPPVAAAGDPPAPPAPAAGGRDDVGGEVPDDEPADTAVEQPDGTDGAATGARSTGVGRRSGGSGSAAERVAVRVAVPDGRCWVEVTDASGTSLHAGVLESGEAEEFTSTSELRLTLGDASEVRLEVDGERLPLPDGKGRVVRLRVATDGTVRTE